MHGFAIIGQDAPRRKGKINLHNKKLSIFSSISLLLIILVMIIYNLLKLKISELQEVNGEQKKWLYPEVGPYQWVSFKQSLATAHTIGSGLRALGLKPVRSQ